MSGCEIYGTVENSVLASDVTIGRGAVVKNSIIMSDTIVEEGASIEYSIIDERIKRGKNAVIGDAEATNKGSAVLGSDITVSDGARVHGGEIIDKDVVGEVK